jgi:hypothetical protein
VPNRDTSKSEENQTEELGLPIPTEEEVEKLVERDRRRRQPSSYRDKLLRELTKSWQYATGVHYQGQASGYGFLWSGTSDGYSNLTAGVDEITTGDSFDDVVIEEAQRLIRIFTGRKYGARLPVSCRAFNQRDYQAGLDAERGTQMLDFALNAADLDETLNTKDDYVFILGTAIAKVFYDPHKPRRFRPGIMGDWCVSVLSPFEFAVDDNATSLEDAAWMRHDQVISKSLALARYSDVEDIDQIKALDHHSINLIKNVSADSEDKQVVVTEYYEKAFVDSRWGWWKRTTAGNIEIREIEWVEDLPFLAERYNVPAHYFFGRGGIWPCRPIFREIDRQFAHIGDKERNSINRILIDKNSDLKSSELTDIEGEILEIDMHGSPNPVQNWPGSSFGMQSIALISLYRQELEIVSGITAVMEGRGGTTSKVHLDAAQAANQSGLTRAYVAQYSFTEELMRKIGAVIANHYSDDDYRIIYGSDYKDNIARVIQGGFMGNRFLVKSSRPRSLSPDPQVARQEAQAFYQMGIYGPMGSELAVKRFMKAIAAGSNEDLLGIESVAKGQAERQVQRMREAVKRWLIKYEQYLSDLVKYEERQDKQGVDLYGTARPQAPQPEDWWKIYYHQAHDDHQAHLDEETALVLSPEFENWPADAKKAVLWGLHLHQLAIEPHYLVAESQGGAMAKQAEAQNQQVPDPYSGIPQAEPPPANFPPRAPGPPGNGAVAGGPTAGIGGF